MKNTLLLYVLILLPAITLPQSGFGEMQYVINDMGGGGAWDLLAADIDNDGNQDIIYCDSNYHLVAWIKNIDGQGTFGPIQYIDQNLMMTQHIAVEDIDNDGDLDVIATSAQDGKVVWYKNTDGQGTFSSALIISNQAPGARGLITGDIDNDGDPDVIVGADAAQKIIWYENLDGLGNFGNETIVATGLSYTLSVNAADINSDGYLDVITNTFPNSNYPGWYPNTDGNGSFGTGQIISNETFGSTYVITKDIDGDGDNDVFNLEFGGDTIAWYDNTDGLGNFGTKQIIAETPSFLPFWMYAEDIDNDGDIDISVVYGGNERIAWFENTDGAGLYSDAKVIDNLPSISVVITDIDNDGYKDIITGADNSIVWYKNLTYLGVGETPLKTLVITPNPVKESLYFSGINDKAQVSINLYDISGRVVISKTRFTSVLDVSFLKKGVYFLEIKDKTGSLVKKLLKN